jgi:hypothetical protein
MARKRLKPSKGEERSYDEFAKEVVFEAEFLALVMEHPHTPNHIRVTLRFMQIAALNVLLERLKHYDGDGQILRDVWPHACVYEPEGMSKSFRFVLEEMEKEPGTKRVLDSIQNNTSGGQIPPRQPHPLKEHFQEYREAYVMAGPHPLDVPEPVKSRRGRKGGAR